MRRNNDCSLRELTMAFYNHISGTTDVEISSGWDSVEDFRVLAQGYASAAARALESWQGRESRRTDLEAYPILFLYRHALELSLKHVFYRALELSRYRLPGEVEEKFLKDHNLRIVCGVVSDILKKVSQGDEFTWSFEETVSRTCEELSELDPGSYMFRYPMDTKGTPTPGTRRRVNLSAFVGELNKVLEYLDTLGFALNATVGVAKEAFAEMIKTYGTEAESKFRVIPDNK
jgi:hypothetical protein